MTPKVVIQRIRLYSKTCAVLGWHLRLFFFHKPCFYPGADAASSYVLHGILAEWMRQRSLTLDPPNAYSRVKLFLFAMSVVCGRLPKTVGRSVLHVLLPETRLVPISNHLKHLQISEEVQSLGKSLGPNSEPVAFDGSEVIHQSSFWSHGDDRV